MLNKEALVARVIPNYFVCGKYDSFTRQLNGWGFRRLYQCGPDAGCFYHECFLRDLPELTCMIRRVPPNQGKSIPHAAGEPSEFEKKLAGFCDKCPNSSPPFDPFCPRLLHHLREIPCSASRYETQSNCQGDHSTTSTTLEEKGCSE